MEMVLEAGGNIVYSTGINHTPMLVGDVYHPDVSLWPKDPGIPVPIHFDDLVSLTHAMRDKDSLCHEFDTELLRSISNVETPMLVHTIYPEPHSGKSSRMHFKMWLKFIQVWHEAGLCVCVFNNDCCSTGLGATKILMTVTTYMVEKGVKYVGLPRNDFQYFGPCLDPKVPDSGMKCGHFYLPAKLGALDVSHHVRSARRAAKDSKRCIVFFSEKGDNGEEVNNSFTLLHLEELARDRRFKGKYGLSEMVTFDNVMDQKGGASWHLHSWKIISLLQRQKERAKGTILALQATYYITAPFKLADMTNPFVAMYWVWRGLAIWETQERYVYLLIKNLSMHCLSPQMRDSNRILAHAVVLMVLVTYIHKKQIGGIQD